MMKRAVVIRTLTGYRIRIGFHRSAAIPEFVERAKGIVGDNLKDIHLINLSPGMPMREIPPVLGKLYCPYCENYRRFVFDPYLECHRCPICGISDRDFYVRHYNHLWKTSSGRTRRPLSEEEKRERRRERRRRRRLFRKKGRSS